MRQKTFVTLAVLSALASGSALANTIEAASDSVLVVFKPGVSQQERAAVLKTNGVSLRYADADGLDRRSRYLADGRIAEIAVPKGISRDALLKKLSKHKAISIAEPNYIIKAISTERQQVLPSDPRFAELWGLHNTGQAGGRVDADIDAPEAWEITKGSRDTIIGIIDTGLDYNHPDLAANRWVNPGEIAGNGVDDDNNGVVDDVYGYSAFSNNGDPFDGEGHGTHVAGTIGAAGDNGVGVVGVNWNATLLPCQFLGPDGTGSTAGAIACINYFTNLKLNHGINVRATNNSWGGGGYSEALKLAIKAGNDAEILFIAAAGNSAQNADVTPHYPAGYDLPGIVAVASTDRNDNLSSFSTYGPTTVDVAAPGSAILSTLPGNTYGSLSGTSMATPHVAGAAGLIWSLSPHLTISEVKQILLDSGESLPALAGKILSGKRINLESALAAADPVPGFGLGLTPARQEVTAGQNALYQLAVSDIADWDGQVNFTVSSNPVLPGLALSASSAQPGQSLTLTAPTTAATAWGNYELTVTGTDAATGELVKTVSAALTVLPQGLQDLPFENTTPVAIPDNNPAGITSLINVPDAATAFAVTVSVDISHTWIGDLIVKLRSPAGTEYTLHNKEGGSADNLVKSWTLNQFNGEQVQGDWSLFVSDTANLDTGRLNKWSLNLKVLPETGPDPIAPVSAFSYSADTLNVNFTSQATDADNEIISWLWNFGDGSTSTEQNPTHSYAQGGSYDVSLTVTDATNLSATSTQTLSLADVSLELSVLRSQRARTGSTIVDLRWSGATADVELYRDGVLVGQLDNNGKYRDRFNSTAPTTVYQLKQVGSTAFSAPVTVRFER